MTLTLERLRRRAFLQRLGRLAGAGAALPWALPLQAAAEQAVQAGSVQDHKALVCVFLYGGNDHANTWTPLDPEGHTAYTRLRPGLATPREALRPLNGPGLPAGAQLGAHPALAGVQRLFDEGRLGVVLNVGPLRVPTSLDDYRARRVPLPPKLFSHNDQQSIWQSGLAEGATSGWGGRLGDLFLNANEEAVFTCVNVSGNAVFMAGQRAVPFQVSAQGPVRLRALQQPAMGSTRVTQALLALTQAPSEHAMQDAHAQVMRRALAAEARLRGALESHRALPEPWGADDNPLARQLHMVARTLAVRQTLGARRQVFLVSLGGFDHHSNLLARHAPLLQRLDEALTGFDAALQALGLASQVTTFTASDFGRTLTGNGDGSDHGWGSHHLVMGAAVEGGRFHGTLPVTAAGGPDDVGQGRLLPTLAVDQFGAALGRWLGVPEALLPTVWPNLPHFDAQALRLFRAV